MGICLFLQYFIGKIQDCLINDVARLSLIINLKNYQYLNFFIIFVSRTISLVDQITFIKYTIFSSAKGEWFSSGQNYPYTMACRSPAYLHLFINRKATILFFVVDLY